jgi:hypothetical protein
VRNFQFPPSFLLKPFPGDCKYQNPWLEFTAYGFTPLSFVVLTIPQWKGL